MYLFLFYNSGNFYCLQDHNSISRYALGFQSLQFISSVKTLPRYLNFWASLILISPFCKFHIGPFFLLTTSLRSMAYVAELSHNTHCTSKRTVHGALTLQVLISEFVTLIFIDLLDSWMIGVWIEQVEDPKQFNSVELFFFLDQA